MSEIDNFLNKQQNQSIYLVKPKAEEISSAETNTPKIPESQTPVNLQIRDEFVKEKKNSGLVGKFYNFLKNKSGIGLGTKKIESEIDKYEKGESSEEQVREKFSQYKISRENAVQQTADVATGAVTITSFFLANNYIKNLRAAYKLDAIPSWLKIKERTAEEIKEGFKESPHVKWARRAEGIIKSNGKTMAVLIPALAILGGLTKWTFTKLERIGSKEYKTDKNLEKSEYKAQKKINKRAKRKENFKNFATGALQGSLAPVTALVGGIVGVPAYLAGITALRYGASKNDNKEKSFDDFTKSLKDNAVINTVATAAIAVPAVKHAQFSKVLGVNLDKVVKKLSGKNLQLPDLPSQKSAYQELEDTLINSEPIQSILKKHNDWQNPVSMDEIINQLTEENIFAVKFLQIKNSGIVKALTKGEYNRYDEISKALREDCPSTRTLEQAQQHINQMWGASEYTVSKLLGVGTVAETYLAKDKSGKEVCIKVLKEGINAEKIARDKEKFLQLVTGGKPAEQLTEDQKYLVKNIEDLASGIANEVDFKHEMQAAKELMPHCKVADVVKPIAAKDGIYVMEKAPGISVKTLVDYYDCERELKYVKKFINKYGKDENHSICIKVGDKYESYSGQKALEILEARKAKLKSRSPEFEEFDMTPAQIKKLLKTYIDLQVEQFSRLDKNGKVIHADIHPGNIFINLNSLKTGKGKLFTLIDTGNTVKLSKEQTKASLRIIPYIKNGNTKDLAQIVIDGATLPKGMSKEEAIQKVEADLKKFFFDSETKIETMNIDTFYALSDNILRKYGIIPNNTQLNLNKAKTSAYNSFEDLFETFFSSKYGNKDWDEMSKGARAAQITNVIKDMGGIGIKYKTAMAWQETKNLFQMSLKEAWNFIRNKNKLKTNSEDYLTFKMKQRMEGPEIKPEFAGEV